MLARSLEMALLGERVECTYFWEVTKTGGFKWFDHIGGFDIVLAQHIDDPAFRATFEAAFPKAIPWPTLVFNAFHPDIQYFWSQAGEVIPSPIGDYNSALVCYAYRAGLSPEAATRLFTQAVFERAGYLDLWDANEQTMCEQAARIGYDLRGPLQRWSRRMPFMTSLNHPKSFVMADIARLVLKRLDLRLRVPEFEEYLVDSTPQGAVWPVYPGIADQFGIEGGYIFKGDTAGRVPFRDVCFTLPSFIARSYNIFNRHDPRAFRGTHVDRWLQTGELGV